MTDLPCLQDAVVFQGAEGEKGSNTACIFIPGEGAERLMTNCYSRDPERKHRDQLLTKEQDCC